MSNKDDILINNTPKQPLNIEQAGNYISQMQMSGFDIDKMKVSTALQIF